MIIEPTWLQCIAYAILATSLFLVMVLMLSTIIYDADDTREQPMRYKADRHQPVREPERNTEFDWLSEVVMR